MARKLSLVIGKRNFSPIGNGIFQSRYSNPIIQLTQQDLNIIRSDPILPLLLEAHRTGRHRTDIDAVLGGRPTETQLISFSALRDEMRNVITNPANIRPVELRNPVVKPPFNKKH